MDCIKFIGVDRAVTKSTDGKILIWDMQTFKVYIYIYVVPLILYIKYFIYNDSLSLSFLISLLLSHYGLLALFMHKILKFPNRFWVKFVSLAPKASALWLVALTSLTTAVTAVTIITTTIIAMVTSLMVRIHYFCVWVMLKELSMSTICQHINRYTSWNTNAPEVLLEIASFLQMQGL